MPPSRTNKRSRANGNETQNANNSTNLAIRLNNPVAYGEGQTAGTEQSPIFNQQLQIFTQMLQLFTQQLNMIAAQQQQVPMNGQQRPTNQQLSTPQNQLHPTNQQLSTPQNQLRPTTNQQLATPQNQPRLTNQQLSTPQNQPRPANQQLSTPRNQPRSTKQLSTPQNQRRSTNQQLSALQNQRRSNQQLSMPRNQLRSTNQQLSTPQNQLHPAVSNPQSSTSSQQVPTPKRPLVTSQQPRMIPQWLQNWPSAPTSSTALHSMVTRSRSGDGRTINRLDRMTPVSIRQSRTMQRPAEIDRRKVTMRSQETAGKPISRPSSGLGGKDWNLREAMKLGGNHQLYRDIRRTLRHLVDDANIDLMILWPAQNQEAIEEVTRKARKRHPYLSRFPKNWAIEEIIKSMIKNKRKILSAVSMT